MKAGAQMRLARPRRAPDPHGVDVRGRLSLPASGHGLLALFALWRAVARWPLTLAWCGVAGLRCGGLLLYVPRLLSPCWLWCARCQVAAAVLPLEDTRYWVPEQDGLGFGRTWGVISQQQGCHTKTPGTRYTKKMSMHQAELEVSSVTSMSCAGSANCWGMMLRTVGRALAPPDHGGPARAHEDGHCVLLVVDVRVPVVHGHCLGCLAVGRVLC